MARHGYAWRRLQKQPQTAFRPSNDLRFYALIEAVKLGTPPRIQTTY